MSEPSSEISRHTLVSVPACGTMPEWNFSAPATDCRHWKNRMPSAPRAIACFDHAAICPGAFGAFLARQFTALGACSMRIHGWPCRSERMRSRVIAA